MEIEPIPTDVRDFLLESISSVAELEALLLLRELPQQNWSIGEIAHRLYIGEVEAAHIMSSLLSSELATSDGTTFRYFVSDTTKQDLIDKVARSYSRYLLPVTKIIHENSSGMMKFADAFKFRKGK